MRFQQQETFVSFFISLIISFPSTLCIAITLELYYCIIVLLDAVQHGKERDRQREVAFPR